MFQRVRQTIKSMLSCVQGGVCCDVSCFQDKKEVEWDKESPNKEEMNMKSMFESNKDSNMVLYLDLFDVKLKAMIWCLSQQL